VTPLFIVGLIVVLLLVDTVIVTVRRRLGHPDTRALPFGADRARAMARVPIDSLRLPGDVFLDRGHAWAKLSSAGPVRVGLDDFAQRFIGRIDGVDLPEPGRTVRRGEPLFSVRQGDRTATFRAPVDGVVRSVNGGLREYPGHLKEDPYGHGWIAEIEAADLKTAVSPLRIARTATGWIREEVLKLRELAVGGAAAATATLPDGGLPSAGLLEHVDEDVWGAFQNEILDGHEE
jgi:glycine cleavage system H protein